MDFEDRILDERNKVADWLLKSFSVNDYRGSSAWYSRYFHPFRGWSYPYPETTGYIIPTLYRLTQDSAFLQKEEAERAIQSSLDWLLSIQMSNGAFPGGHCKNSEQYLLSTMDYLKFRSAKPVASIFNSAQILRGFLSAFNFTSDSKYITVAEKCANYLVESINKDGTFALDAYAGDTSPSYFSYTIPPLLEIGKVMQEPRFIEAGMRSLRLIIKRYDKDSKSFLYNMGFQGRNNAFTHTIAYTVQGFQESFDILGESAGEFTPAIQNVVSKLFRIVEINKKLDGAYAEDWVGDSTFSCLTGNCQIGLCFLHEYFDNGDPRYLNSAARLYSIVESSITSSGAIFGSVPIWGKYMSFRWPNWAAKYFIDLSDQLLLALRQEAAKA